MAKYGSNQVAFLLAGGYDLLGFTTQLEDTIEALTEDKTVLGEDWVEMAATGLKRASLTQQGFYDDEAGASNAALASGTGVQRVLCYGVEGNTIGKKFTGYAGALQADYARIITVGELHKANASYQGSGVVEEGLIVHAHGAETADGDTEDDAVDNGASSANGGAGYLQVSALDLDGYDDIAVSILHSADDETYAELLAFTDVTAAPAAERVEVSGTVNRYIASEWAFEGTGTSPSATFMAGFVRNP